MITEHEKIGIREDLELDSELWHVKEIQLQLEDLKSELQGSAARIHDLESIGRICDTIAESDLYYDIQVMIEICNEVIDTMETENRQINIARCAIIGAESTPSEEYEFVLDDLYEEFEEEVVEVALEQARAHIETPI